MVWRDCLLLPCPWFAGALGGSLLRARVRLLEAGATLGLVGDVLAPEGEYWPGEGTCCGAPRSGSALAVMGPMSCEVTRT